MAPRTTGNFNLIFYWINDRGRLSAHGRPLDKRSYFLANIECPSLVSCRSPASLKTFRKVSSWTEKKLKKLGTRNRQDEDGRFWEKTQETKLENRIFGDSVSKMQKNNLTEFRFGHF